MPAKQNVAFFWDWSADKQVSSIFDKIEVIFGPLDRPLYLESI